MTRETSIEAYNQIEAEGLLSPLRWRVYQALFRHGPCTANELVASMRDDGISTKSRDYFAQRLSELRESGAVKECGARPCKITGRMAIIWDVTKKIPETVSRPVVKDKRILKAIAEEREACAQTVEPLWPGAARRIRARSQT